MYYVIIESPFGRVLAYCRGIIEVGDEAAYVYNGQPEEHRGHVAAVMFVLNEKDPNAVFARVACGASEPLRVTAVFYRHDMPEEYPEETQEAAEELPEQTQEATE
jgi:hypothetical protein